MNKQIVIDALKAQLKEAKQNNGKVYHYIENLHKAFGETLKDKLGFEYTIVVSNNKIQFDSILNREVFSIRVDDRVRYGEDKKDLPLNMKYKLELSSYSFGVDTNEKTGLKRAINFGKLAEMLLSADLPFMIRSHYKECNAYREKNDINHYGIERELSALEREVASDKIAAHLKLGSILKFNKPTEIYISNNVSYKIIDIEVIKVNPKSVKVRFNYEDWYSKEQNGREVIVKDKYAQDIVRDWVKSKCEEKSNADSK